MQLTTETSGTIESPDESRIIEALRRLDGFAILGHDELTYVQAAGSADEGFVLEHQQGSTEEHYACPQRLSLNEVTQAFIGYAKGDDSWPNAFQWQKLEV